MDLKKLNEEIRNFLSINESSNELRQRYIDGRTNQIKDLQQQIKDLKKKQKRLIANRDKQQTIQTNNEIGANGFEESKKLIAKIDNTDIYMWSISGNLSKGELLYISNYIDEQYESQSTLIDDIMKKLAKEFVHNKKDVSISKFDVRKFINKICKEYYNKHGATDYLPSDFIYDIESNSSGPFWNNLVEFFEYIIYHKETSPQMVALTLLGAKEKDGYDYIHYYGYDDSPALAKRFRFGYVRLQVKGNKLLIDVPVDKMNFKKQVKLNPQEKRYAIIDELSLSELNLPSIKIPSKEMLDCIKEMVENKSTLVTIDTKLLNLLDWIKDINEKRNAFINPFTEMVDNIVSDWIDEYVEK